MIFLIIRKASFLTELVHKVVNKIINCSADTKYYKSHKKKLQYGSPMLGIRRIRINNIKE
jgi:hypothetical protein